MSKMSRNACMAELILALFHLSRLRGRSHCIERCNAGGGNSLDTTRLTRGGTPSPDLPRKRERERTSVGSPSEPNSFLSHPEIRLLDGVVAHHFRRRARGAKAAGLEQIGPVDHAQHLLHVLLDNQYR